MGMPPSSAGLSPILEAFASTEPGDPSKVPVSGLSLNDMALILDGWAVGDVVGDVNIELLQSARRIEGRLSGAVAVPDYQARLDREADFRAVAEGGRIESRVEVSQTALSVGGAPSVTLADVSGTVSGKMTLLGRQEISVALEAKDGAIGGERVQDVSLAARLDPSNISATLSGDLSGGPLDLAFESAAIPSDQRTFDLRAEAGFAVLNAILGLVTETTTVPAKGSMVLSLNGSIADPLIAGNGDAIPTSNESLAPSLFASLVASGSATITTDLGGLEGVHNEAGEAPNVARLALTAAAGRMLIETLEPIEAVLQTGMLGTLLSDLGGDQSFNVLQ